MDLLKAALNNSQFRNQGFSNFNTMSPQEKLREQLFHCTYNDDTKFVIQRAVKQVLHVYPYFQTQILQFVENGQQKRFLEIKGIMEITVKGKPCKVDYNMMLPNSFPKKPPYVRIINRNEYMVDHNYKNLRSPTDPKSFILNERLISVKNWNQNSSIVSIVMQSNNIMRQNFPFYKAAKNAQQSTTISSGWSNLNNQNSPWGQNNNQYNNFNQGGFNNFNNQGFSSSQGFNNNQGFNNQGFNQGFNNQGFNNQGFNNQGFSNNNNFGGFSGNPIPPIPFNNNVNVNQAIANSQKFVGQSKKILEKMKAQHIKAVQKIQHLETIKFSLESEQGYLRIQNNRMFEFLKKNEKSDFRDLTELIQPKDERSQQILDLVSSIKAKDDCISLLQERFGTDQINFDEFLKLVKKIEEEKFQNKVLLNKCIQS